MSLPAGVPVIPREVDLGTRMAVIAASDPALHATVSEAHHLSDAFLVWRLSDVKVDAEESCSCACFDAR